MKQQVGSSYPEEKGQIIFMVRWLSAERIGECEDCIPNYTQVQEAIKWISVCELPHDV